MDMPSSARGVNNQEVVAGARAVFRVLDMLKALAARPGGVNFVELRQMQGLPKSSMHRLLRTLEQAGYIINTSGNYLLGPESARLANLIASCISASDLPAMARPIIEQLAGETHEAVALAVLSEGGDEVVYVDVINSYLPLQVNVPLANRRPLYTAASGMVVLAFLPESAQSAYLTKEHFEQLTADTYNKEQMLPVLKQIRQDAFAFCPNSGYEGVAGMACPVFDSGGKVICAITVIGPTERMQAMLDRYENSIRNAASRLSHILGFTETTPPTA